MPRTLEQFDRLGGLHHLSGEQDGYPVAHLGDHGEVVGDEQDAGTGVGHEVAQQVEDLRLNGHVETGRWLVGDEDSRTEREGHRDDGPLAHPAG